MDIIERGQFAAEIINNPLWDETFSTLELAYIQELKKLKPKDERERFLYVEALRQIELIKVHIEGVFAHGKQAAEQAQLAARDTLPSKIARLF